MLDHRIYTRVEYQQDAISEAVKCGYSLQESSMMFEGLEAKTIAMYRLNEVEAMKPIGNNTLVRMAYWDMMNILIEEQLYKPSMRWGF